MVRGRPGSAGALIQVSILLAMLGGWADAHAQAWLPFKGEGTLDVSYSRFHGGDHLYSSDAIDGTTSRGYTAEGNRWYLGDTTSHTVQAVVDYAFADRWAGTVGLAYVATKYVGSAPVNLEVDDGDVHATIQDAGFQLRYALLLHPVAITPEVGYGLPMADYVSHGHAAQGLGFAEWRVGLSVGQPLGSWLPRTHLHGRLTHSVGERQNDRRIRRTLFDFEVGHRPWSSVGLRFLGSFLDTAGGQDWLDADSSIHGSGEGFVGTAFSASSYVRLGGGIGYSPHHRLSLNATYISTVWGENIEDGDFLLLGASWAFRTPLSPDWGW
jgi:hypothetical protein